MLRNPSSKDATIRAISLARPEGVSFVEAFVTDIENQTLIGISPWPLKPSSRTESWERRQDAVGAVVYGKSPDKNLVVHFRAHSVPASFEAVEIDYELDGKTYTAKTATSMVVKEKCF